MASVTINAVPPSVIQDLTAQAQRLLDDERHRLFALLNAAGDGSVTDGPAHNALGFFVHELDVGAYRDAWRDQLSDPLRDVAIAGRAALGAEYGARYRRTVAVARATDAQADRLAGLVTSTTADRIAGAYRELRQAGEVTGRSLLERLYSQELSDTATAWRAGLIGQTEGTAAYRGGAQSAAIDLGVMRSKTWLHDGDPAEPRDWHVAMDGETVDVDEAFSNGCQFPGDPDADPSETINCTCSVSYNTESADDMADLVG